MTWNNVQPLCNTCVHCAQSSQDHRNHQCSTMPHAAYLHSQVVVLRQLLSMFLANVAISRTADINKKTSVCLSISETDVWTIGFDLPIFIIFIIFILFIISLLQTFARLRILTTVPTKGFCQLDACKRINARNGTDTLCFCRIYR